MAGEASPPGRPAAAGTGRGAALVALVLALALGLALRAHALDTWPLWIDEAATAAFARLPWSTLIGPLARVEPTPPTYYMLMKGWTDLAGSSTAALRWPSVLASAAAILPVFVFAREAFGLRAARYAGLLMAASSLQVVFAQQARVYALLCLVFCCGLVAAQRLVSAAARAPGHGGAPALWFCCACIGLVYLHITGLVATAALFVYAATALVATRRLAWASLRPLLGCGAAVALAALPILWIALGIAGNPENGLDFIDRPGLSDAYAMLMNITPGRAGIFQVDDLLPETLQPFGLLVASLLAAGGLLAGLWQARVNAQAVALGATLAFAVLALYGISQVTPILLLRTLLFAQPLLVLLIAAGAAGIQPALLGRGLFLCVLIVEAAGAIGAYRQPREGEDWGQAAARIAAEPPGQVLVIGVFSALALERALQDLGADRPVEAIIPVGTGERIHRIAWQGLRGVEPLRADSPAAAVCARLRPGAPVVLVWLQHARHIEFHAVISGLLRSLHAAPQARIAVRQQIRIERWSVPDCPAAGART